MVSPQFTHGVKYEMCPDKVSSKSDLNSTFVIPLLYAVLYYTQYEI